MWTVQRARGAVRTHRTGVIEDRSVRKSVFVQWNEGRTRLTGIRAGWQDILGSRLVMAERRDPPLCEDSRDDREDLEM